MRFSLIVAIFAAALPAHVHGAAFELIGEEAAPTEINGVPLIPPLIPAPVDTTPVGDFTTAIPLNEDGADLTVNSGGPDFLDPLLVQSIAACDCVFQNGFESDPDNKIYLGTDIKMVLPEGTKYFLFYVTAPSLSTAQITVKFEHGEAPAEEVVVNSLNKFQGILVKPMPEMGNPVLVEAKFFGFTVPPAIGDFHFSTCDGGLCGGDPHFKTWNGLWYDFHGACDLVFLKNPDFAEGVGMDIHLRTTQRYKYSFIESAALRIGDDILQVDAYGQYYVNGVGHAAMPMKLDGKYTVTYTMEDEKRYKYSIDIGKGKFVLIETFKDLVSVKMNKAGGWANFGNSAGLMGNYVTGDKLSRNGTTINDPDEFGNEWQVLDTEARLFLVDREPQHPVKCSMPGPAKESRRLGEALAEEAAATACNHYDGNEKDMCIYDVMASGDLELAQAGVF